MFLVAIHSIYAAELAAPGVKNMGGTMEWLSGLRGWHPMQFFHTLWPVCLLSAALFIWLLWAMQECMLSASLVRIME